MQGGLCLWLESGAARGLRICRAAASWGVYGSPWRFLRLAREWSWIMGSVLLDAAQISGGSRYVSFVPSPSPAHPKEISDGEPTASMVRDYSCEPSKRDTTSAPMHPREYDTCTMKTSIFRVGNINRRRSIRRQARCMSAWTVLVAFLGACMGKKEGRKKDVYPGRRRIWWGEEGEWEGRQGLGSWSRLASGKVMSQEQSPSDDRVSTTGHNHNHVRFASVYLAARQQQPDQNQHVSESTMSLLHLCSVWLKSRRILQHTAQLDSTGQRP